MNDSFKNLKEQILKVKGNIDELLKKYIVRDERERQKILEEMEKADKIKLEKGHFYEVEEGMLIGMSKDGRLLVYLFQ